MSHKKHKTSRRIAVILILVVVLGITLLSFGRGHGEGVTVAVPGSGTVQGGSSATSAATAPDFSLKRLNGATLTLSEYQGEKPVILDFFATWCPNCRRDIPKASKWYEVYKDRVEVIGVNLQEHPITVQKFAEDFQIPFPIVLDPRGMAARLYEVHYTNFHILIDRNGVIVRVVPGDIQEADFQELARS